ncbi:MAG: carbohydrate ABC transporter permease [Clostridia bacterium]|nr:carbohydrate ABC transporter permease [Clostridia bacterium]
MAQTLQLKNHRASRLSRSDRIFYTVVNLVVGILGLIVLYPLVYILSSSFSSPSAVAAGKVVLFPVNFSLRGYKAVFDYQAVYTGYRNTIFYTVVGTALNIALTMIAAYPLARRSLPGKGFFTFLFTFTMMFSGGMIPNYILMKELKIINTAWCMLLPGAISAYNLIVTRTFIQNSIPEELLEAAQIDGCNDTQFFFLFILPLSKAVMAVITLYYAVSHWNAYFSAFLYLNNRNLYPLQIFLREILIMNSVDTEMVMDTQMQEAMQGMADLLKYSLIVVSTAPILCIYPFLQRYFIKGVMIGSLKG